MFTVQKKEKVKMMKKILSFCLIMLLGLNSACFAVPNYTYTRVVDENYSASSPVGQFSNYAPQPPVQNVQYYVPYQEVTYVSNEPVPVSYQNIQTPQSYNKRTVVTESMHDDRDPADKAISRAWGVTGIIGVLGLVTMGIIGAATGGPHHHGPHR